MTQTTETFTVAGASGTWIVVDSEGYTVSPVYGTQREALEARRIIQADYDRHAPRT